MRKIILLFMFLVFSSILIILIKNNHFENKKEKLISEIQKIEKQEKLQEKEERVVDEVKVNDFENDTIGLLIIPSIEVKAIIKEGTSQEVLKYTIRTL